MIEYSSPEVVKLFKQYKMFSKSLRLTMDLKQKNDICEQMTKIIEEVLDITNSVYKEKYNQVENRSVYLMSEEKNRLLELINLINERKTYIKNQIDTNKELTGLSISYNDVLGEDNLEEYMNQVAIIDKYKKNTKLESTLKEDINSLDYSIKKANSKINNNHSLNKRLEDNMINITDKALTELSLYELQEREKEIELAYTELGYSLEKAKENAKIARRDYSEEIVIECDNMLAAITLEFERYKEKKLILQLINIFKNKVGNYDELLDKREKINDILMNIQSSELYSLIGNELNKEYATIKLEAQDVATLKSLVEEKDNKIRQLEEIEKENNSDELKGMLEELLENEKKHQAILEKERQKQEEIRQEKLKEIEKRKKEEILKHQKILEEERKKEIEERTKQLLVEKKNPVLISAKDEKNTKTELKNNTHTTIKKGNEEEKLFIKKNPTRVKEDIFSSKNINKKVVDKGVPVIKDNKVIPVKKKEEKKTNVFPDIPLEKKEDIFPSFPEINSDNGSFFDDDEFKDLSNYMEDNDKKSWF